MKSVLACAAAAVVVGCASQSANMHVGTSQSYSSLKDQREAVTAVKQFETMPSGAVAMGQVDASRCHRNTLDAPPSDELLLTDLKVAAYARGADGITGVQRESESGLLKNCWYIVTMRATAFRLSQ